jgi:cell division cycle protein 20 (cofactor of APC complex)
LNITPRTRRISKQFGLIDDRVLNFGEDIKNLPSSSSSTFKDDNTMTLLRKSASTLFYSPPPLRLSSVTENLNKRRQCVLTLDSPGIASDPEAFPISWSLNNCIAVACGRDVFYQNLDNKIVSHLGHSTLPGGLNVIEWAGKKHPNYLAAGNIHGWIQTWDATRNIRVPTKATHSWFKGKDLAIKSISWNDDVMAVGADEGLISLVDIRTSDEGVKISQHRDPVLGLKWSTDGTFLASGDRNGLVYIWDKRAAKSLLDTSPTKIRNQGSARVS